MNNLLMNTLSQSSFIILNKKLVQHFKSLEVACVVSYIIDKCRYFDGDDFYYTIDDIVADTFISERTARAIIKRLIDDEILIDKGLCGVPPKRYFNININALINILNHDITLAKMKDLNPSKNETLNPSKSERDKTCKSERDIYNNNIYKDYLNNNNRENKNKENNNKNSKNIKKVAKSIFDEALELYPQNEKLSFSFDDWKEWVEYKKSRSKNLTILTFKKNLQQLKSFGNLAKEAIDNSISNNWVGLFKPQQTINQNQSNSTNRNFKGGYLEAKDKFANMSNENYDDSAYDFSLLPSETCGNGS